MLTNELNDSEYPCIDKINTIKNMLNIYLNELLHNRYKKSEKICPRCDYPLINKKVKYTFYTDVDSIDIFSDLNQCPICNIIISDKVPSLNKDDRDKLTKNSKQNIKVEKYIYT
jgi:ssDNA-binding Zn-finger/Zn-ribbon topoisomerase 1